MLASVRGIYRNGQIELVEKPRDVHREARVIVVFLEPSRPGVVNLRTRGIDEALARELRTRLETFAEEWDSPEMDVYDHYDEASQVNISLRHTLGL